MTNAKRATSTGELPVMLSLLGAIELVVGGERVALPRSKKCRALLGYLALTERAHRRERLCSLLWDVADDPKGALRWSLSRIRRALGPGNETRIVADRDEVSLRVGGMWIDACELLRVHREGIAAASTEELERIASAYRGELLEGLELLDFHDFTAWCIHHREALRRQHCQVLVELIARLRGAPDRALPFARQLTQADAFDANAQAELLRLLFARGSRDEATRRFEYVRKMFRDVSAPQLDVLEAAWSSLKTAKAAHAERVSSPTAPPVVPVDAAAFEGGPAPFVGRQRTLAALEQYLVAARTGMRPHVALVTGEPGAGKTRLAERLFTRASTEGVSVLVGRSFVAESTRPFGPWTDALDIDVSEIVVEGSSGSRDGLFAALLRRLDDLAANGAGVLLVLDDVHWLDRDSAELLHYVTRTHDRGGLRVLLLARGGELFDNKPVMRLLRGLRRDRQLHDIELEPLDIDDIEALLGARPGVDPARVHAASGGNPLYALELARAWHDGLERTPPTIVELVRERIERLPDAAADVLRWGAVLGHAIDIPRLEELVSLSQEDLVSALERLEQCALLQIDATRVRERYVFGHALIRDAVYSELSLPRRRLMHRKVALLLEPLATEPGVATEVAHHAHLAGEAFLGVRACTTAARHALRVFANADAEVLARRGLRLSDELSEADRVSCALDLLQVLYSARAPDRDAAAADVRALAERALDLGLTRAARQGFQMVSFLRWESSSLGDAHKNILQAERVSRSADPMERTTALAQAAKCLVLLERNLGQAEAFVMEANAVATRSGESSAAVSFALAMIAAHRGEQDAAAEAFKEAQHLARRQGEHLAEFGAIEHRAMLEIDRGRIDEAMALADELVELGGRVRPGTELAAARALRALAELLRGDDGMDDVIDATLAESVLALTKADAKYELAYVLCRWADDLFRRNALDAAHQRASEALATAQAIGRRSDEAFARAVLVDIATRRGESAELDAHRSALERLGVSDLSAVSRLRVACVGVDPSKDSCGRPVQG